MSNATSTTFKETSFFGHTDYDIMAAKLYIPVKAFKQRVVGVIDFIEDDRGLMLLSFHYRADLMDKLRSKFGFTEDEINAIKMIRGIVVDLRRTAICDSENPSDKVRYEPLRMEDITVVCRSFPYTEVRIANSIPEDGSFDYEGFQISGNSYKEWIHGTLIRIFMWKGVVYASTHRKISCAKSRFAGSKYFLDMLMDNQTAFPTLDSFFGNDSTERLVHLFIINDQSLIIESTKRVPTNRVYYIESFSIERYEQEVNQLGVDFSSRVPAGATETEQMSARIIEHNIGAEKPIKFPETLDVETVNLTLNGGIPSIVELDGTESVLEINTKLRSYVENPANRKYLFGMTDFDSIIMRNEIGVYRIMPPASRVRNLLMSGNPIAMKVFTSLISHYSNNSLKDTYPFINFGISRSKLEEVVRRLKNNESITAEEFDSDEDVTLHEKILTNMIFSFPRHLLDKCLEAYDQYTAYVMKAFEFLWDNRESLKALIFAKKLSEFEGIENLNSKTVDYIKSTFCGCFTNRAKIPSHNTYTKIIDAILSVQHWNPELLRIMEGFKKENLESYEREKTLRRQKPSNKEEEDAISEARTKKFEACYKQALLCMICNAPPDTLYSLLQMKEKVIKTREAHEKSRKLREETESSGKMSGATEVENVDFKPTYLEEKDPDQNVASVVKLDQEEYPNLTRDPSAKPKKKRHHKISR